ncbi:hypothetical protein PR048_031952 [Dryococelus australis]|uniref:PDZ domain-containing protein n=1 Tax=Dryococelus australis TaxID=614101 RepID=A0ABQ9G7B7_9NEOP|nr:hypothetical protein PR048_031952 [Dryococelus australis]
MTGGACMPAEDKHQRPPHQFNHKRLRTWSQYQPSTTIVAAELTEQALCWVLLSAVSCGSKVAMVSPTKKVSPGGQVAARGGPTLMAANTRKMGRRIELELVKGPHGLGFSITTRDNPAGGNCPIYIKNILPKGAAVRDGRLKPGDRLLEVNGVEMTGKTQAEAVSVLRNAPPGSKVRIVVSRQEDTASPKLPRPIASSPEKVAEDLLVLPWKHREILTFDIPVHDTEKAGLGVSVKGKTSASHSSSSVDLGIFVKSVLHGGAASRDGRLKTNDQLLNVNGISLLGQSNSDAMETLRRAGDNEDQRLPTPTPVLKKAGLPLQQLAKALLQQLAKAPPESPAPNPQNVEKTWREEPEKKAEWAVNPSVVRIAKIVAKSSTSPTEGIIPIKVVSHLLARHHHPVALLYRPSPPHNSVPTLKPMRPTSYMCPGSEQEADPRPARGRADLSRVRHHAGDNKSSGIRKRYKKVRRARSRLQEIFYNGPTTRRAVVVLATYEHVVATVDPGWSAAECGSVVEQASGVEDFW